MAWKCGNLKTKRYQLAWAWLVASFWTFAALAARSPASNDKRKMGKWGHCHHPQYRHPEIQFPMTDIISTSSPPFDRPVCCFLFDLPSHQLSPVASASPAPSATKQSTRAGQHGNCLQKLTFTEVKNVDGIVKTVLTLTCLKTLSPLDLCQSQYWTWGNDNPIN